MHLIFKNIYASLISGGINMRFAYEGANLNSLIKKYEINESILVVTFFDDKEVMMDLSEEENILETLLEQAIERNENLESELDKLVTMKKRARILLCVLFYGMLLDTITAYTTESSFNRILQCISGGLLMGVVSVFTAIYKEIDANINELNKYDLYLKIKDELEQNFDNPYLFTGINKKKRNLNINTLDGCSLKDLKKLRNNLSKIISENNTNTNVVTLTKKNQ